MFAVLAPAKRLDFDVARSLPTTSPALLSEATALIDVARRRSPADLAKLMSLSPALASLTHERFQAWNAEDGAPAALVFAGDTYQGLDARTLSDADLAWAQDHLGVLSGLYGVLRPLDVIQPYRLEMGTKLANPRGRDLYAFWGDRVAKRIDAITAAHADRTVVCLASSEYASVVRRDALASPWLSIRFEEVWGGKAQVVGLLAKKARGMMARFVVTERVDRRDGLKDFTAGGYAFQPARSGGSEWVFSRQKPPPKGA